MSTGDLPLLPKLPLWRTIGLAYSSYLHDFFEVLEIAWLWLLIVAPLVGYATWQQQMLMATLAAHRTNGMLPHIDLQDSPELAAQVLVLLLAPFFAGVSISVAWHRHVILGEQPAFSGSNVTSLGLWRYLGTAVVLWVISLLTLIAGTIVFTVFARTVAGGTRAGQFLIMFPVMLTIFSTIIAIMLRLCPLLPAQAVDDFGLTFTETWQRTRGNTWRIFWGFIACTLPPEIALWIAFRFLDGFASPAGAASEDLAAQATATLIVSMVLSLLIVPIGIGFLSHVYRHFFRDGHQTAG